MCGGDDHLTWKCPLFEGLQRVVYCQRVRVKRRLVRFSERSDMDQQVVIVDQFMTTMASIQEALASLKQEICSQ
ncbi:hypothetical protein CK203_052318 [Vitis vinifera]|uniref:Uncharacterized protein n=1 Tax=Vitis vinifera TaxID=29760 RepID=A0A438FWH1_VITVI|nr:hypothetical protein CK203_052318 [Vitis vinifera]